jgi:hypothetical protein
VNMAIQSLVGPHARPVRPGAGGYKGTLSCHVELTAGASWKSQTGQGSPAMCRDAVNAEEVSIE